MFVYTRLFSIVLGFSSLFTLVSCQDRRCFQYQKGKQDCKGFDRPLSVDLCRVAREKVGASACGHHTRLLETQNNKCSCPLTDSHSKKLSAVPVPSRLYKVFDELGKKRSNYCPGTKWCSSCRNTFKDEDKLTQRLLQVQSYLPPRKRCRTKVAPFPLSALLS